MKHKVLKVHPKDNVIVALANLTKGETISFEGNEYVLQDNITAKHKFFTKDMNEGDEVIMYGVLVGKAQNFIPRGGLMRTSNVKHAAQPYSYRAAKYEWHAPDITKYFPFSFFTAFIYCNMPAKPVAIRTGTASVNS